MKKYVYLNVFLIAINIFGCASLQKNYGKLKPLPKSESEETMQGLIDTWKDYDIYYAGFAGPYPLGIIFDPKNNDTAIVGDRWKRIKYKDTLLEVVKWIRYDPMLNEILGPDGQFYGYLYYSMRHVTFKMVGDRKMYVFNLEHKIL
jgi:hypothetical protein